MNVLAFSRFPELGQFAGREKVLGKVWDRISALLTQAAVKWTSPSIMKKSLKSSLLVEALAKTFASLKKTKKSIAPVLEFIHATLGYEESLRSSIHVGQSIRPVVHPLFVSIFVCSFVIWVPMNRCLSINQSICAYISVHPAVGLSGCRLAVFDTRFKFWCVNTLLSILLNLSYRSRALSNVRYVRSRDGAVYPV